MGAVDAVEWACVLCGCHIQNDWVGQRTCTKFWVKLEHSSAETIRMTQKAAAMGSWWLAASSRQCACSCITSCAEFLVKHQIIQVTQLPYSPDLAPCDFWLFAKLKSSLKGDRFQTVDEIDSGKYDRSADGNWENCVKSRGAYFGGDWGIIVLCTMFLVSCNFFNKCLYFSQYMVGYFLDRPQIL